jgi:hypothetical protein
MDRQAERINAGDHGFSKAGYEAILRSLLRGGYSFVGVESLDGPIVAQPYVFLRHDIDLDLEAAVEVARWDADLGVRSTFFLAVQSPFFDPTTRASGAALEAILALGHDVCLHLDVRDPVRGVATYAKLHKALPKIRTDFATIHSPRSSTDPALSSFGLLDAAIISNEAGFTYVSDSQGAWRYGHPLETAAFAERVPLHINTHPEWWASLALTPIMVLTDPHPEVTRAAVHWFPKLACFIDSDYRFSDEPIA